MEMVRDWSRPGLDVSARAGVLLGAAATGMSYQPNLLSRGTRDQAIITGATAAVALGWGTSSHSFWRSMADRIPASSRSRRGWITAGTAVDATVAAAGFGLAATIPWQEHESGRRALLRLGAGLSGVAAAAGLGADALEYARDYRWGRGLALGAALAVGGAAYAWTRPGRAVLGALAHGESHAHEDVVRQVSQPVALASGVGVTVLLLTLARGESALSAALSRGAATVLGGEEADHRTAGRIAAYGMLAGAGWAALTGVNYALSKVGEAADEAHSEAPGIPEITGGPGSAVPWTDQSRESRRWLSMALRPDVISGVMGEPAIQPIRVYGPLLSATRPEDRAALLLAEIDRTKALERSVFALFSPTGSGYVNYVATETLEYLTRGNCASACIQYSVLPSALSLTKVGYATHQSRILVNGIAERLAAIEPGKRPRFVLFGESLGSQVSEEMFEGQGATGPRGAALDAAVWIGTPSATLWRREMWGSRTVAEAPRVDPPGYYLPRAVRDWHDLPADERAGVRFLLLQNGADPVPKFDAPLLWRRPDWLGPDDRRPPGSPTGTKWLPVSTFLATFIDLQNALVPTPGTFQEGGHDYRREIPEAVRSVFGLEATEAQMDSVQEALRSRELGWEVRRDWAEAEAKPTPERADAQAKVLSKVSGWVGHDVDAGNLQEIIDEGTEKL